MSYRNRRQLPYENEGLINEFLINFFVCLSDGFGVAHFIERAPALNAQFAANKSEIKSHRFGALDLKEKSAKDYINYGGRLKKYDG